MSTISVSITRRAPRIDVTPGRNRAAAINAALTRASVLGAATGTIAEVWLGEGTYYLESRLLMTGGWVRLVGLGDRTILVPTFEGTGDADALANHVIDVRGSLDTGRLSATLTADACSGSTTASVGTVGTVAAGDWVAFIGNNDGGQNYPGDLGFSDGGEVILVELARLAAAAGTTLTLEGPLRQNHAGPTKSLLTVKAVTPVRNVEIADLTIRGSQGGTSHAVGIAIEYAVGVRCTRVRFEGFSRAGIVARGALDVTIDEAYSLGTNNSWIHFESVIGYSIRRCTGADGVARSHPDGYPREQIYLKFRCTDGTVADNVCTCGTMGGIFYGGGVHMIFTGNRQRNMVVTQAIYDRWLASPEGGNMTGGFHALGFGSGNGPLGIAEFAFDVHITDNVIEADTFEVPTTSGWFDESTSRPRAWCGYVHDTMATMLSNYSVLNKGKSRSHYLGAIRYSDCEGVAINTLVVGVKFGYYGENVGCGIMFHGYRYNPVAGDAHSGGPGIYLNHWAAAFPTPTINGWRSNGDFGGFLRFGPDFYSNEPTYPDNYFVMRDLQNDNGRWDYAFLAYNATGVSFGHGEVVEIDPSYTGTGLMRIRTPVTTDPNYVKRLVVVVTGAGSDYGTAAMLVAPLSACRGTVKVSSALVARGDQLVYDEANPRQLKADNSSSAGLAVSRERKAAGSAGLVIMSPPI